MHEYSANVGYDQNISISRTQIDNVGSRKLDPTVIDIPVRQRLSEFAYKNVIALNHESIRRLYLTPEEESPLFYDYLRVEFSGKYNLIKNTFGVFGEIASVEWPDNNKHPLFPPNGFAFIVFCSERSVHHLLHYTKKDGVTGATYVWFKSETEYKPIEIRPWRCVDATFLQKGFHINKAQDFGEVFIGGIPRSFTALQLATILEENFKLNVFSVIIDVDNVHRYPKGTAKVTFCDNNDVRKAIAISKISLRIGNQLKHMEIKLFRER
ncbi:Cytoplasmic polyadenylation element-binding protein 2 [Thelohanellus kitauei]|uniref:Cytoplasmic polyadenylation element-binding protein 2 n=1 Tax=Thelohanellus kitauei TaxID=669202 RepID=A0A0C2N105_THEKT|nr:Cytoplasmic polyadenylation element-binding protein 2 [Thelohanellus kitauei]